MNRLDTKHPGFWENLSFLSQCHLKLELPSVSFQTSVDVSSAHLVDNTLCIPGGGLSLEVLTFEEAYASSKTPGFHLISENRKLGLRLTPKEEKVIRQFHYFSEALAIEEIADHFEMDRPDEPQLCPCCIASAQFRIRQMAQNPITVILAHAASARQPLIVSTKTNEGGLTMNHTPTNLRRDDDMLISEGHGDQVEINIRHLHAMHLNGGVVDGRSHQSLTLLNSHGHEVCTISAPSDQVREKWIETLRDQNCCYEVTSPSPVS